jgi:dienelactone hydrolase
MTHAHSGADPAAVGLSTPERGTTSWHPTGQHKKAPGIVARARRFVVECGFAVAAVDAPAHGDRPKTEEHDRIIAEMRTRMQTGGDVTAVLAELHTLLACQSVPEWRTVLDAVQELDHVGAGPVGYWGMSLGCGLGVPFIAAEPRIRAAVLGLNGAETSAQAAAQITVPVEFLVQWDDERVPRAASLALFDLFASAEKTLHASRCHLVSRSPPNAATGHAVRAVWFTRAA